MKLLDGSLSGAGGATTEYGAKYGVIDTVAKSNFKDAIITSDVGNVTLNTAKTATKGGESATWDETGRVLTFNLVDGATYTQAQIDKLIENADTLKTNGDKPNITVTLKNGIMTNTTANVGTASSATVGGERASSGDVTAIGTAKQMPLSAALSGYGDQIKLISNSYGADARKINLVTDAEAGKESVETLKGDTDDKTKDGVFVLHLSTGKEYTEKDIQSLLAKEGLDYSVDISDSNKPDGDDLSIKFDYKTAASIAANGTATAADDKSSMIFDMTTKAGQGIGKEFVGSTGKGLTFQIGANGVEDQRVTLTVDDMSSSALGVANADVSTRAAANEAIEAVDQAVKKVSMQRAGLGALQNRLEYTVNNLTTTNENLTNAESQIRDTDMATEMINYTKFNILQQASQAMLAQANQQPQAVLQLLG